jgi:hypothetical protein
MLFARKCCTKAINVVNVTHFHNLKSHLGCTLQNGNFVVAGSKLLCKSYSYFGNLNSRGCNIILMSQIQNYLKKAPKSQLGILPMSTQTMKTKGSASTESQGIHENVSALQMRIRLQRRKRPSMEEEDSRKLGVW